MPLEVAYVKERHQIRGIRIFTSDYTDCRSLHSRTMSE